MALRQQQAAMQRELRQAAGHRAQLQQQVNAGTAAAGDLLSATAAPARMASLEIICWQGSGPPHCCNYLPWGLYAGACSGYGMPAPAESLMLCCRCRRWHGRTPHSCLTLYSSR